MSFSSDNKVEQFTPGNIYNFLDNFHVVISL